MEENIAILFADLSGYTSLTETHGAFAASDLIEKYLVIVKESLVGRCKFQQQTGDEVLIVASSPNDLLHTATTLIQKTSGIHEFLQVHGGLHYGKILYRNDNYFGSTINIAARIAAKANSGSLWCSEAFIQALTDVPMTRFEDRGVHSFKNVSTRIKTYELVIENTGSLYIDPVCRMLIRDRSNAVPHPEKEETYFCSEHCLNIHLGNKG